MRMREIIERKIEMNDINEEVEDQAIEIDDLTIERDELLAEVKSLSGLLTAAVGDYNDELEKVKLLKKQAMRLRDEISYHESLGNRME